MSDYRNDRIRRTSRGFDGRRPVRPPAPQPKRQMGGREPKRQRPVWFLVIVDLLVLGLAFNVYGIFEHMPRPLKAGDHSFPPASSATANGADPSASPSLSATASPDNSSSDMPMDTASPDASATEQPPENAGMWGEKFADKFTDGEVEQTENSYRSHDISVSISTHTQGSGASLVTYYVADIYVRNLENLKAGLANGKPLQMNQGEMTDKQAQRYNAIIAVNGDNYGDHNDGMVVRNGDYGRNVPYKDVCVLFKDGTMKTYGSKDFRMADVANDAWQVWGFGPMLLDGNGNAMTKFDCTVNPADPRTAIGYYEPGHYCFVVVDGRQSGYSNGMTTTQLSQLFEDLGCKAAYNLDGGRTTGMAFMGNYVDKPWEGGRSTSDIIYIAEAN